MSSNWNTHHAPSADIDEDLFLNAPLSPMDRGEIPVSPANNCITPIVPQASTPIVPTPVLQNVVSTVDMECKLDLKKIVWQARNTEYSPNRFSALIMRIRQPKTTALIFPNGKMVITGGKSAAINKIAARRFARIVQKLGYAVKFTNFTVQNLVGTCDVGFPINLIALSALHAQFSSYEPEIFAGLTYRMVQPSVVLLIFQSGKVIITGAKVEKDVNKSFEQIYPVLQICKK